MENKEAPRKSLLEKILDHKGIIFVFAGIGIRIFMLFYYYYTHMINPNKSWGDIGTNFNSSTIYPPLTLLLLSFFNFLSFGSIEIFAFWGFILDLFTTLMFYFVIKNFDISNKTYVFGLFLINPFLFLNNSFSLENCGYHLTDSFFFFFLFMALLFYPKKGEWDRYLFYIFLALSIVAKLYTLPILGYLLIKFMVDKNWKEMKVFLFSTIPILIIFLIAPFFYWEHYLDFYNFWNLRGEMGFPLYIRLIPPITIFCTYLIFRIKKGDIVENIFVSIFTMASFMFFSNPYIRYFQSYIFYGILKPKEFFTFKLNLGFIKREIIVDNNLLVFYFSIFNVFLAYLIIIFIL